MLGAYSSRDKDVLGEDNALSLNDKEVDELVKIANQSIKGLLGKCVVLSWAELRGQTSTQNSLSDGLSEDRDT